MEISDSQDDLVKQITREKIPCGECVTTTYFDLQGKIVKRDIDVIVTQGFIGKSSAGGQ